MLYGIEDREIQRVVAIIRTCPKVSQAILFGSRALGTFEPGSDIALKGAELKLKDIIDLKVELEELLLPYKMDLIIYDRVAEPALVDHINRVGIKLFER